MVIIIIAQISLKVNESMHWSVIMEFNGFSLGIDYKKGAISSLAVGGRERICRTAPLFRVRLRDKRGEPMTFTAFDAGECTLTEDGAVYGGFSGAVATVRVRLAKECGEAEWRISVTPKDGEHLVEWVEFPGIILPPLTDNNPGGTGGKVLLPYNEGVLVSDMELREGSIFKYREPEYPSKGSYAMFPNMVCSQMLAYVWDDVSLYIGAHDKDRGVKDVNLIKEEGGVGLRLRIFCGVEYGEEFKTDYPIVFAVTDGGWESAAERYRAWFESCLPEGVKRVRDNSALPRWYGDSPLVVTYPVRGIHDTDIMEPNKLYPYVNALPILEEIKKATDSRLLVLLMHWEGTAPWAPPYVWPPFGGADGFNQFKEKLHAEGDMLGVYCSGFGYTSQSRLIADYNREEDYKRRGLCRGMCADADGEVKISRICTAQRQGYDICPASDVGRALLDEAYAELLSEDIDYVQILDQNHGGGQYFCYSRDHGHPPAPGPWMTENMGKMLTEWNGTAGKTLLGCESAAAEPFIGNLLYSDNRYELNYHIGTPVPLYSYVYHEYLRNFMGNQVNCPLEESTDTLLYRLAYSFAIGDSMTLVLTQEGGVASYWGQRDLSHLPDKEKVLRLIRNLTALYKGGAEKYLLAGRMIRAPRVNCDTVTFLRKGSSKPITLDSVLATAWQSPLGEEALILVNPRDEETVCTVLGGEHRLAPLSAEITAL